MFGLFWGLTLHPERRGRRLSGLHYRSAVWQIPVPLKGLEDCFNFFQSLKLQGTCSLPNSEGRDEMRFCGDVEFKHGRLRLSLSSFSSALGHMFRFKSHIKEWLGSLLEVIILKPHTHISEFISSVSLCAVCPHFYLRCCSWCGLSNMLCRPPSGLLPYSPWSAKCVRQNI